MRVGFTLIELMIVIAIIAIIAAIAIPNLLESRITSNEVAAAASLKSGVFPGQVQFQAGGYQDVDADNVGEYGTVRALAGLDATAKIAAGSIRLVQGPLATPGSWTPYAGTANPSGGLASGFRYVGYAAVETSTLDQTLSLWADGGPAPTALAATTNSANNGERYWVVAAAPEKFGDSGRRVFIISNEGQVCSPAQAAALGAFFAATSTPANGTPSTSAGIAQGIHFAFTGALAALAPADLTSAFHPSVPAYTR